MLFPVSGCVLYASDLVLYTEDGLLVINMLSLLALRHDFCPLASLRGEDADAGRRRMVVEVEAIGT